VASVSITATLDLMGVRLKDITLALGGGGARGVAHIHVLAAFDDLGIKPAIIAGSSIGAIMAIGYASGISAQEMREYVVKSFSNRAQVMARLWRIRPQRFGSFSWRMPRIGELDGERVLRAFLPAEIPESFDELQIPVKVTATDFYGNKTTIIEQGRIWPAMAASAAIPAIFRPVLVNGRYHIDGGISNPVPFDLVEGPDRQVVAVDVVGLPDGDPAKMPSRIDAVFGASQLMMQTLTQFKLKHHRPDILIRPPINAYRVLDFLRAEEILAYTQSVREETRVKLEKVMSGNTT
jgi:NTE family protein